MIDKTLFCDSIRALQAQYEHDSKWGKDLAALFPNENIYGIYDNHKVNSALLHILQVQMNDATEPSWIEYFCYEIDFGKNYTVGSAFENGINVDLSSPESLYDHLASKITASK